MSEMTRASLIIRHIVLLASGLMLACAIYLFPRDEIQGIRVPDSTYLSRLSDAVRYRSLIKGTLAGNPADLEALVGFWCGGAGGCYEHGAVIVHIMYKMGDRDFYRITRQIDADSINGLEVYISAGFENVKSESPIATCGVNRYSDVATATSWPLNVIGSCQERIYGQPPQARKK